MRVLISGATGFIGRRLVHRLTDSGHELTALTRDVTRATKMLPGVTFNQWNPGEALPAGLIDSVDAVVNLAGESVNGRWTKAKKDRILSSRVEVTRAIVDAMDATRDPKVLINASAVGIYGDRGDDVLTETSPAGEGFLKDVVVRWEDEARRAAAGGSRVAIMRFGIVLGPEGGALQKLLPLAKLGLSGPVGSGKQWWPWVHVDDLTKSIEEALGHEMSGVFNITSPQPVRQREFASVLGKVVHRPSFLPAPEFALRLAQGEFADELVFSKRVMPAHLMDMGFHFDHVELESAFRHLLNKEKKRANVPAHA